MSSKRFLFLFYFIFNQCFAGINFSSNNSKIILNHGAKFEIGNSISDWTGSLEKKSGAIISGEVISFDDGIFKENNLEFKITGAYVSNISRQITLSGNERITADIGTSLSKMNIVGSGNRLLGQPLFNASDSIRLENVNSELILAVQTDLNSNIEMRGGTVKLESSLRFEDDFNFTGSGSVDLQGHSFKFGSRQDAILTHTIDWYNSTDINLGGHTIQTGVWNFNNDTDFNGHGYTLDLSSGGTLNLKPGVTLNLTDVVVKGLGLTKGSFAFEDDAGVIRLSNVVLELDERYHSVLGGFLIDGPTTFVLKNYDWTFDQNVSMTVEGMTLWKDAVAYDGTGNQGDIKFGSGDISKYLTLTQSGTIGYIARGVGLLERIKENSNAILQNDDSIKWNSNAILNNQDLISYNSSAILAGLKCCENNSNAIINIGNDISYISSATIENDNQINYNSSAIIIVDEKIRYNSNVLISIDENDTLKICTGFDVWYDSGNYYNDSTLGSFTVLRGGKGYIKGKPVTWVGGQTVTGLTSGNTYLIYVDNTGTLGKTAIFNEALYEDNIPLFECLRDSTPITNNQITVKENHPYTIPVATSLYLHNTVGSIIENKSNGANITLNGTKKIEIVGNDRFSDHGLYTDISDSGGTAETFNIMYTTGVGKWALHSTTDTFLSLYNNAGTPTVLSNNKYGVYRLYVSKDDLNLSNPTYYAILNNAEYSNITAADSAISNGDIAEATSELFTLELAQLGYIVYSGASDSIVSVIIEKATARSSISGGGGTNLASLVLTDVTNFNGVLSSADTTVQAALETIDYWVKNNSNLISYNSAAILASKECCENNSNAIINLLDDINNISNATIENDDQISWNSSAILNIGTSELAEQNSNAIISLNECCDLVGYISNATIENDNQISWNSSVIINNQTDITNNSNAIVSVSLACDLVYQNSDAIINLLDDIENISNATINNDNQISWNSSAILNIGTSELAEQNSNAIVSLNECCDLVGYISNATIENDNQISWNSSAILNNQTDITNNSNAILSVSLACDLVYQNSDAIINLLDDIENISNATIENDDQISWNSSAILNIGISELAEQNSNAIISLNECCDLVGYISNSTIENDNQISWNSSAILNNQTDITNNSNAIVSVSLACDLVYQNSDSIINLLDDIENISNATIENDDQISWNSSAILNIGTSELAEQNSNAIISLNECCDLVGYISNATIENDNQISWNSSAIINNQTDITNNSNAIVSVSLACDLVYQNSDAIINLLDDIENISNATINNDDQISWNSSAILNIGTSELAEQNSNAIISLNECCDLVGYISNATIENDNQISWNSSAIINNQTDITNNSNAIVSVSLACDLVYQNSDAIINLLDDIENISNATIDNDDQISWNSSAILNIGISELAEQNSNAIISLNECCDLVGYISNATIENDNQISWNSSAIINNQTDITNNSNAILSVSLACDLVYQNSDAIINLLDDIENISNATIENDDQISWNSSAILNIGTSELAEQNSNAIISLNECCDLVGYISNATIENDNQISWNSSAIINNQDLISYNSSALLQFADGIENNSNAIVALSECCDLVGYISNATIENDNQISWNSSAIINNQDLISYNSSALLQFAEGIENNSNAIISLDECCDLVGYISNATIENDNQISWNSSAILNVSSRDTQLAINNSNALVSLSFDTSLAEYNSNVLVNLVDDVENNSNAIISLNECCDLVDYVSNATIYNDQHINNLQLQLNTIDHGPANIHVDTTTTLSFNIYLGDASSYEHKLYIHGGAPVTLDGSGRYVHFARDAVNDLLIIDDNTTLILENIVLKDFLSRYVSLGTSSDIIFGDGTTIELAEDSSLPDGLSTLKFQGNVILNGYGHRFQVCPVDNAIEVASGSSLIIENTRLEGLRDYNVRCLGPNAHITYRNDILMLCQDYTFSDGTLTFSQDVTIKGKDRAFIYKSAEQSKVVSNATLLIDRDVEFRYDAGNTDRGETSKTAFILENESSILYLNGCSLHSTRTGLKIERGTIVIDDKVEIRSDALYDAEAIEIMNAVDVQVLGGATVDAYGIINLE